MPRKPLLALAFLALTALVIAGTAFSRSTATPTLKGVVGPGFTIKLTKGGKRVKTLKAGRYKFAISDKSSIHNFVVERAKPSKPKIERSITSVPFKGTKTVVMTLKAGRWSFYCAPHESQMHGDFRVTR
jgi:plastocyanin